MVDFGKQLRMEDKLKKEIKDLQILLDDEKLELKKLCAGPIITNPSATEYKTSWFLASEFYMLWAKQRLEILEKKS